GELARGACFDAVLRGPPLGDPLGDPAVEHGRGLMPEPSQQPPETARVHAGVLVVGDHLDSVRDAEPAERRAERSGVWQGVPAVRSRPGSREIVAKVCIDGTGDVARLVLLRSPAFLVEVVAAV